MLKIDIYIAQHRKISRLTAEDIQKKLNVRQISDATMGIVDGGGSGLVGPDSCRRWAGQQRRLSGHQPHQAPVRGGALRPGLLSDTRKLTHQKGTAIHSIT
jgi:hypothetical protein